MSLLERLRVESLAVEQPADPWRLPLERVRGKIGDDGIERITTQALFDTLERPTAQSRSRGVTTSGQADDRTKVVPCAGTWALARRLYRTSTWLRPRRSPFSQL